MNRQRAAVREGQGAGMTEEVLELFGDADRASEEGFDLPPVGTACVRCFSSDLVESRRPGLFGVVKLFGCKVYRCRQCLARTIW